MPAGAWADARSGDEEVPPAPNWKRGIHKIGMGRGGSRGKQTRDVGRGSMMEGGVE